MTSLLARSAALRLQNEKILADSRVRMALGWRIRNGWRGIGGGSDTGPSTDPVLPHWPLDELERLVRDKIRRGALFILLNDKFWAGPATGQLCCVCTQAISSGNECEIRGPRGYVYAHLICHRLWYRESEALRDGEEGASG
jgi:hypothetical protein